MNPGDEYEVTIEGIGSLKNRNEVGPCRAATMACAARDLVGDA